MTTVIKENPFNAVLCEYSNQFKIYISVCVFNNKFRRKLVNVLCNIKNVVVYLSVFEVSEVVFIFVFSDFLSQSFTLYFCIFSRLFSMRVLFWYTSSISFLKFLTEGWRKALWSFRRNAFQDKAICYMWCWWLLLYFPLRYNMDKRLLGYLL